LFGGAHQSGCLVATRPRPVASSARISSVLASIDEAFGLTPVAVELAYALGVFVSIATKTCNHHQERLTEHEERIVNLRSSRHFSARVLLVIFCGAFALAHLARPAATAAVDVTFQLDSSASQLTGQGDIVGEILGVLIKFGLSPQNVDGIPGNVADYQGTISSSIEFSGTTPTNIAFTGGALDALPSNVALPGLWNPTGDNPLVAGVDMLGAFDEVDGIPTEPADYGFKITGAANVAIRDVVLNLDGDSRPVSGTHIGNQFGLSFANALLDIDATLLGEHNRSLAQDRVFLFEMNLSQDPGKIGDEIQWRNIDGVNPNGTPQYGDIVAVGTTSWPGVVNIEDPDFPLSATGDPDPVLLFDGDGNRLPQIFENASAVNSMLEVTGVNGDEVDLRLTLDVLAPARFFVDQYLATITLSGQIVATATVNLAPGLPGDANGDDMVDGLDYLIWAENFGDDPADDPPGSPANGDLNDDNVVDGLDYLFWASNFGASTDGITVPEPSLAVLCGPLALVVLGWRPSRPRRAGNSRLS
jgi:hypothetical protein